MDNRVREIIDQIEEILNKIRPYINGEGGSGTTNGRDGYLTTAGDYDIYLLADGGYDKRIGYVTVTLTEEMLAADEIKFEFNGKEQEMGQKNEFVLPIEKMIL